MSVIIYQDHIEILEQENAELHRQVLALKSRIRSFKSVVNEEEDEDYEQN